MTYEQVSNIKIGDLVRWDHKGETVEMYVLEKDVIEKEVLFIDTGTGIKYRRKKKVLWSNEYTLIPSPREMPSCIERQEDKIYAAAEYAIKAAKHAFLVYNNTSGHVRAEEKAAKLVELAQELREMVDSKNVNRGGNVKNDN